MAILAQLQRLFAPSAQKQAAHRLHVQAVQQARALEFYLELGVPDTLDGRFEMITLHIALLLRRLKQLQAEHPQTAEIGRLLSEIYFADMDRSLREMGASDTGITYRMKAIVGAFYGRLQAYENALEDDDALEETLKRNIYGTLPRPPAAAQVSALGHYVRQAEALLVHASASTLLEGHAPFPQLMGLAAD